MIRIFTKQALRFKNPNKGILDPSVPGGWQPGQQPKEIAFADLFFDTVPGTVQDAPDWIKAQTPDMVNINTWNDAVTHGWLVEMPAPATTASKEMKPVTIEDEAQAQLAIQESEKVVTPIDADAQVAQQQADIEAQRKQKEADALDSATIKTRKRA